MKLLHLTLTLSLAWSLLPADVRAAEYWRFETEEGVASFVDDFRKIPEKYRDRAVKQESKGLDSYARATQAAAPEPASAFPELAPSVVMRVPQDDTGEPRQYTRTKEFRWVDGPFGAPSEVYTLVEVVRDADGEIVSVELHDPDSVHVLSGR